MLSRAEKTEASLIGLSVAGMAAGSMRLPSALDLGTLVTVAALALLLQGFFRDLWILYRSRGQRERPETATCICAESAIGLSGVLIGVVASIAWVKVPIALKPWHWPALAVLVWGLGFVIKDIVIQWRPWAVRRIKNHGSIVVRLR
jgi:hypothetical protein